MKHILKQLFVFIIFFSFWYSLLIPVSYFFFPDTACIDTQEGEKTVFYDTYSQMVLDMPRIALCSKKELFLIGSSNVREGFRAAEMQLFFPGYKIHNLGSGGSNITQYKEQVDLIMLLFPKAVIKNSIFVFGSWYGDYVNDEKRWKGKPTNVTLAAMSSGLYKSTNGQISPVADIRLMSYLVVLRRPCFALTGPRYKFKVVVKDTKTFVHELIREKKINFSVYTHKDDETIINDAYKEFAMKFWQNYLGAKNGLLKKEQFEKVLSLCNDIAKNGATVIIVDLPLPKWHSEHSTYYADYQRKKVFYIKKALKLPKVRYINMQDTMKDSDFYDSAHPKSAVTKKWSELLGKGFAELSSMPRQ